MLPKDALTNIRSVSMHYTNRITGFSFFDKKGSLIWKTGGSYSRYGVETVKLEENEVIVDVDAKMYDACQTFYADWDS